MHSVLIFYLLSVVLFAVGVAALAMFFKKRDIKLRLTFVFLGILFSVVYFVVLFVLFFSTFNANSDQYFFTKTYLVGIGLSYVFILSIVRCLLMKVVFFNKEYNEQGLSFTLGFGTAPALFIAIYLLLFFFVIAYNGLFNGPAVWNTEGYFVFEDNTIINLLLPKASGALYAMIALIFYATFTLIESWLYKRISEKLYKWAYSILFPIAFALLETGMILPIPYINLNSYWQLSIISVVVVGMAILLVNLLPKEKAPQEYTRQFE